MNYQHVFEEGKIGHVSLQNRIVMPGMSTRLADSRGISNGDIVKVYNDQACIEMKAVCSKQVPKDIVMVYQGWYPDSDVSINDLISAKQEVSREPTSAFNKYAFFDTFVNVEKF